MQNLNKLFTLFIFIISLKGQSIDEQIDNLFFKKDFQNAIPLLVEKIENDSTNYLDLYRLGLAYKESYQYSKSLDLLRNASRQNSNDIEVLLALADNFYLIGNIGLAAVTYREVLEKDADNFRASIELSKINIESEDYNSALQIFKSLIKRDSTNAFLFSQMAFCEFKLGNGEAAIELYKKSLQLNNYDIKNYLQIAKIFFIYEKYDSSFAYIKEGLEINPRDLPLNKLGAEVLFKMKKYRAAIIQYDQLILYGDTSSTNYQKLGFSQFFVSGSTINSTEADSLLSESIKSLSKSFEQYKDDPLTTLYLGLAYKDKNDYETAIAYFDRTLEIIYPDYISDVYTHLGVSYEMKNDYKSAVKSYKKALEFNPEKTSIIFQLASLYDRNYADKSVPLLYYEKYLNDTENPDSTLYNYSLKRISDLKESLHFTNGKK
ncbi:MAG: tetratricopeptide repeat protein [Melioribacteraceae bacterium]|nr:tetratricopeptide repeat protein [Melioribacteraceae bacterium]